MIIKAVFLVTGGGVSIFLKKNVSGFVSWISVRMYRLILSNVM